MKTVKNHFIEQLGIVEEGEIVKEKDLEGKEEVEICQEHMKLLWNTDGN